MLFKKTAEMPTPETALPRWRATWVDGRIAAEDVARDAHDAATPA